MRDIKSIVNENLQNIDESKIGDWFKGIGDKIFGYVNKLKTFVVVNFRDKLLGATSPLNSFIAYAKGILPKSAIAMSPSSSQKGNISKVGGSGSSDDIIKMASYQSTIDMWKGKGVNEELKEMERLNRVDEAADTLAHHPDMNVPHINSKKLHKLLGMVMKQPDKMKLLVWGAPGIGKTAIIRQFVKACDGKKNIIAIELTKMNPDDFTLPYFTKDSDGKILGASDMPKSWLPCYKPSGDSEVDKLANNVVNGAMNENEVGEGGIMFFDEISRCSPKVQNVALTLIQDRSIGEYKIGSKWGTVAAANRRTDDEIADIQFSKTLANRFSQVNYVPVLDEWLAWADTKGYMNKDVLAFLKFNEEYWYTMNPEDEDQMVFATPRTWEACCRNLANMANTADEEGFSLDSLDDDEIEMIVSMDVGKGIAGHFMTYYRLTKEIDINALYNVWDTPTKAPKFTKRMDLNYFMVSKLMSALKGQPTPEQYNNFCKWIGKAGEASLAMSAISVIWDMYPDIKTQAGDPRVQKIDPENWDKYAEGIQTIIAAYPGLDGDFDAMLK